MDVVLIAAVELATTVWTLQVKAPLALAAVADHVEGLGERLAAHGAARALVRRLPGQRGAHELPQNTGLALIA